MRRTNVAVGRMRVVASSSSSLGLTVESGGGYGVLQQRPIWQSPPVQLDLLPMRSSHSSETSTPAAPASSITNNPFSSWQMLASRTNSARSGASHECRGCLERRQLSRSRLKMCFFSFCAFSFLWRCGRWDVVSYIGTVVVLCVCLITLCCRLR